MDRRGFLKASARAATLTVAALHAPAVIAQPSQHFAMTVAPGFTKRALEFSRRLDALSGGRVVVSLTATSQAALCAPALPISPDRLYFGPLQRAVDVHPGFAFFAGLPGALGIGADVARHWRTQDGARLWRELQAAASVTCLAAGATHGGTGLEALGLWSNHPITTANDVYNRRILCDGLARDVARGIGAIPVALNAPEGCDIIEGGGACDAARQWPAHFAFVSQPVITRVASTLVIMVSGAAWRTMPADIRALIASAARLSDLRPPRPDRPLLRTFRPRPPAHALPLWPRRAGPLDPALVAAVDRVAEAVVADLAGADDLTRRINTGYFAAHPEGLRARAANAV